MGAIVGIDGIEDSGDITKTGELWRNPGMVGKSSPLLVDGRLYAFDDGGQAVRHRRRDRQADRQAGAS